MNGPTGRVTKILFFFRFLSRKPEPFSSGEFAYRVHELLLVNELFFGRAAMINWL
jgi:hypothetical protein